jgi:hypothetical protein
MTKRGELVSLAGLGLLLVGLAVAAGKSELALPAVGVCAYLAWCIARRKVGE